MTVRPDYRVIPTTADVGFEVRAADRDRLYADAVLALYDLMVGLDAIRAEQDYVIEVEGVDDGDLLVALLSRCLYLVEVEGLLFSEADTERLEDFRLRLRVRGEPVDEARHAFSMAIKAITYHELRVEPADEGWVAHVIVDV